jgi:acetate kinase
LSYRIEAQLNQGSAPMPSVLTLNGGSSSIRFAVFETNRPPRRVFSGKMERVGDGDASVIVDRGPDLPATPIKIEMKQKGAVVQSLLDWLETQLPFEELGGVGHRVVHGMLRTAPERVTEELLHDLKRIIPFDPEHLPREIELVEAVRHRHPKLPQAVCFDTAFHRSMPRVATQLPIPRRYAARGIQRYGFHGLSYTYLMQELRRLRDPAASHGRVILAHLGSGASLAAVKDGQSMDTSMGFTPTAGLVMGTRSGDLDPGLMSYLASADAMTPAKFQTLVNHESGLLGVSETSADVRDLLERESDDPRAAEALALFCYQAKKWIGSFSAALGGLDTLVFAGGIGENSAPIRNRICEGLGFLGIDLDGAANDRHAPRISTDRSGVSVRVLRTDEESVIAILTSGVLGLEPNQEI